MADMSATLEEQVCRAIDTGTPLNIRGSNSKHFLGRPAEGEVLNVGEHRGIVDYDPRELVLSARAGTPLAEIEAALDQAGQMLTFEPPHFGEGATLGGTLACGLSGPRRPYAGSARDAMLGCKLINGKGERLRFGGQVIKNVAGYDVSRLMVGAYGTLGVLLEISLKVLPAPAASLTLIHEWTPVEAISRMSQLLSQPMPVDAACYHAGHSAIRLAGSEQAVRQAQERLGGEVLKNPALFWQALREHRVPFFHSGKPLYRVLVKPATLPLAIAGDWLLDWGGAQRWLVSEQPIERVRACVAAVGGHVTQFRTSVPNREVFQPLSAALFKIHQRLKKSFDPHGIFNPGRLYPGL